MNAKAAEPPREGADGLGVEDVLDVVLQLRPRPPLLLELLHVLGLCLDEGVLSLFSLICCSYGYSTYKQERGRNNDGRPSSKPASGATPSAALPASPKPQRAAIRSSETPPVCAPRARVRCGESLLLLPLSLLLCLAPAVCSLVCRVSACFPQCPRAFDLAGLCLLSACIHLVASERLTLAAS